MDVTAAWAIAKTAGELSKKLYEFGKNLKDREAKQQIDEILDGLRELKQSAANLEDENRELREKLRFKSEEFEFRSPFWYDKAHPERPLCPKCFSKEIAAPTGKPYTIIQGGSTYRACLVCNAEFMEKRGRDEQESGVFGPAY